MLPAAQHYSPCPAQLSIPKEPPHVVLPMPFSLGGFPTRISLQEGFNQRVALLLHCLSSRTGVLLRQEDEGTRHRAQSWAGVGVLPETRAPQAEQHPEIKNKDMYSPMWPGNSAGPVHLLPSTQNFLYQFPLLLPSDHLPNPFPAAPPEPCLAAVNCVSLHTYTRLMGGSSAGIHCSVFIAAQ